MNKNIPLEKRARLFLLETMCGKKPEYSFSNPKFSEEIEFLESKLYLTRINNNKNFLTPYYALTQKGMDFAAKQ